MSYSDHGHPTPTAAKPLDWPTLQLMDRQAARNIVCLLTGVFLVGVIMYFFIAWTVASSTDYWVM
jgi:hypothetical protein